jgi:outer membrane lipoprotein-sorting protein
MSLLRRLSTRGLLALAAAVCVLIGGSAAIAVAASGGGPVPPAKPLDQAIQDALGGGKPDGVSARIVFTNRLFPSGALTGQVGSALMSGASGRLWLTSDGRGRLELQSDSGDVQIVWNDSTISIYDASSNTVYRATLPANSTPDTSTTGTETPPTLADIDNVLSKLGLHWALSDAQPTDVAGQAAYSVTGSPKHDGGLLGYLELAFDATNGVPLRAGIYAQGASSPVLELAVSDITYGPVADSDVDVAPPADAKVVDLSSDSTSPSGGQESSTPAVTGLPAVQAAADFPVVVPDTLVGLPLKDVRLVGGKTVLAFYGEGLGGIALVERKADASSGDQFSALPTVSLDGVTAHELATPLGTVLEWQSNGTSFVLAGSQPASAAETAAQAVK